MYKIMGIGDIAQCLLNSLLVLFLGGNTLGHVFGSECLGYCGHCTGSPSAISQKAALAALTAPQDQVETMRQAFEERRNYMVQRMNQIEGVSCIKPEGAFYLFVKSPVENEKEFCEVCKQYNVLVVPGSSFACPGYVRIAYCVSYGQIERSLPAFRKIAEHYNLV